MVSYCASPTHDSLCTQLIQPYTDADDELEIEDFAWDPVAKVFHSPCPCGDRFQITRKQLAAGEDTATCPSCSLIVRVIYDQMDWEDYESEGEDEVLDEKAGAEDGPVVVTVAV